MPSTYCAISVQPQRGGAGAVRAPPPPTQSADSVLSSVTQSAIPATHCLSPHLSIFFFSYLLCPLLRSSHISPCWGQKDCPSQTLPGSCSQPADASTRAVVGSASAPGAFLCFSVLKERSYKKSFGDFEDAGTFGIQNCSQSLRIPEAGLQIYVVWYSSHQPHVVLSS